MLAETIENYLKTIYNLSLGNKNVVTNQELALKMNITPATVTEAVRKLAAEKLVNYEKSYGVRLSAAGQKRAITIIRRHRIWETFLAKELGFGWEEVHEIAEELEHITNEKLIRKLSERLGNPIFDPHGDPIPDERGKFQRLNFIRLSDAKKGSGYQLAAVLDDSSEFLKFLNKTGLYLGEAIQILDVEEYDGSMLVSVGKKRFHLSHQVCEQLMVKK